MMDIVPFVLKKRWKDEGHQNTIGSPSKHLGEGPGEAHGRLFVQVAGW